MELIQSATSKEDFKMEKEMSDKQDNKENYQAKSDQLGTKKLDFPNPILKPSSIGYGIFLLKFISLTSFMS